MYPSSGFNPRPHAGGDAVECFALSRSVMFQSTPPRAWGTWIGTNTSVLFLRFIPTCVGNMPGLFTRARKSAGSSPCAWGTCIPASESAALMAVHPHARGEHALVCHGSPLLPRFIPTHVGNMLLVRNAENIAFGSSPRTWGTSSPFMLCYAYSRFIPTHVGNIAYIRFCSRSLPVHPHARGEHIFPDKLNP